MIDDVVANLPPHLGGSLHRLLRRPVRPRERIRSELDGYTRRIDDAARHRPHLDVHLAETILRACRTLLEDDWDDMPEERRRLVQLACDYYVDPADEEDDLGSAFGFDDDAEVLNAVLDALGRPELKVRV